MTTITLHCVAGDHPWEREKKRGVRPKNCPEHSLSETEIEPKAAPRTARLPEGLEGYVGRDVVPGTDMVESQLIYIAKQLTSSRTDSMTHLYERAVEILRQKSRSVFNPGVERVRPKSVVVERKIAPEPEFVEISPKDL